MLLLLSIARLAKYSWLVLWGERVESVLPGVGRLVIVGAAHSKPSADTRVRGGKSPGIATAL
jgi:hypothetical protein